MTYSEKGFQIRAPASSSSSSFNPLHPFTPQPFLSSLPQPQPVEWREALPFFSPFFFFFLFAKIKRASASRQGRRGGDGKGRGAIYSAQNSGDGRQAEDSAKRCTHEPSRSGPAVNCHYRAHKFAGDSGTFYSSVLPCSQCRSGEIIGRREQLQRERGEGEREGGVGGGEEREKGAGST